MRVVETVSEIKSLREAMKGTVGIVPTMGFLHEGHMSLIRRAREDNPNVIVSIFVNPTQFGPSEDFDRYPRNIERDLEMLRDEKVDVVFNPPASEIYPPDFNDWVEMDGPLTERLEGASRPGFFRGVCTVVARLFRIIEPDRAYFGQKDAQQLRVIREMVSRLKLGVKIVPMPIVREPDGLAMSSRNAYLSPGERAHALALSRALREARRIVSEGEKEAERVRSAMRDVMEAELGVITDYVSVADEKTLEELDTVNRPALALVAAQIGPTRLIDNTVLVPPGKRVPKALAPLVEAPNP